MNSRKFLTILIVFMVALIASAGHAQSARSKKSIQWHDFAQAVAKAKAENKLIVVDFYTDWCSWCKVMDAKTYGDSTITAFAGKKLVMAKVNAESNETVSYKGNEYTYRQLAAGFGVRGYPATIFLDASGEFITSVPGYVPAEQFLPILEFLDGKHYVKMSFEKFLEARNKKS